MNTVRAVSVISRPTPVSNAEKTAIVQIEMHPFVQMGTADHVLTIQAATTWHPINGVPLLAPEFTSANCVEKTNTVKAIKSVTPISTFAQSHVCPTQIAKDLVLIPAFAKVRFVRSYRFRVAIPVMVVHRALVRMVLV